MLNMMHSECSDALPPSPSSRAHRLVPPQVDRYAHSFSHTYVRFTVATCITGLFIFQHGGFGPPHALAIVTLIVLAVAT